MSEEELALFSEKKDKKKKKRIKLANIDSHTGLGRAIITAPFTGGGSLVGGYVVKNKADELDRMGLSDDDILIGAKKFGGKVGAATGTLTGISRGLIGGNPVSAVLRGLGGAGLGYIGGSEAARVNTKDRLEKRRNIDLDS